MAESKGLRLAVAAPAYNEEEGIEAVIRTWIDNLDTAGIEYEIVITNDGSSDNTGNILDSLQQEFPQLKVVTNSPNKGYGFALLAAIRASTADYVMTLDSDGQFDVNYWKALLTLLEEKNVDIVTGYRMGKKDTFLKVFADRAMNVLVRNLFGISLRDTNCAQKLGKGDLLRTINLEATGYPTPTEMMVKAHHLGMSIAETGVAHFERQAGLSKLHPWKTAWKFLIFLFYLRIKISLYRKKVIQTL